MADIDDDSQDDFQTNNPGDVNPMAEMKDKQRLEQDYNTPFSEPSDQEDEFPNSHQLHDYAGDIDDTEAYDENSDNAALDQPASNLDPDEAGEDKL